jgi:asparagine synthase (glutamine-hydrolysing)
VCGIGGLVALSKNPVDEKLLARLCGALAHRGPDGHGIYVDPEKGVGLVHTRLAILDLTESGRQPMGTEDGTVWLVYNGEVYNYREIRGLLEARGYTFRSSGDAEVVLKAYVEWGVEAFPRFNGMFALGIWDRRRKQLILARDRAGVKPLYYYWDGKVFLFGSELKTLMAYPDFPRRICADAVCDYLRWGYIPAPLSVFEDTHKLEPGHYLILGSDGDLRTCPYWELPELTSRPEKLDEARALEELRDLMKSAFAYRLVSDVPVGVFLSGGVDSSLVTAILRKELGQPAATFSIGFSEQAYDESPWARQVARCLDTDHHEWICSTLDMQQLIPRLPDIYDEPFADSSAIPACLLARFTRNFVKVALSGDGGDEVFAGYRHHLRLLTLRAFGSIPGFFPFLQAISGASVTRVFALGLCRFYGARFGVTCAQDRARKFLNILREDALSSRHLAHLRYWDDGEIQRLLKISPIGSNLSFERGPEADQDPVNAMLRVDFKLGLPDDMLTKMDRACMSVGLENREPLLDYRIVEWAFSLPGEYKVKNGTGKYLLKKLLERYLPPELVYRPKQGFIVPLHQWLRSDLAWLFEEYLSPEAVKKAGIFDEKVVQKYVQDFLQHGQVYAYKLWALIMFQAWFRRWIG